MRGNVLLADIGERIGIGSMRAMAHQRAGIALRVVVLGSGKAVVDEECGAALEAIGQRRDEGFGLRMDLGDGAGREHCVVRRTQVRRAVIPGEGVGRLDDAALEPALPVEMQQLYRHRVEHFVADHDALHRVGQCIEPMDFARVRMQRLALAFAQAAREIDDAVAADPLAERVEQLKRERARAGAEFPQLGAAACVESLRHLARERAAEQGGQFGCGDEVAA